MSEQARELLRELYLNPEEMDRLYPEHERYEFEYDPGSQSITAIDRESGERHVVAVGVQDWFGKAIVGITRPASLPPDRPWDI